MLDSPKLFLTIFCLVIAPQLLEAQILDKGLEREEPKSSDSLLHMDATYNRPTLQIGESAVNIGGYIEANSMYEVEEGDTEGLAFQMRRLAFVIAAPIAKRINFLSEIEFENNGKEVSIEYAAVDVNLFSEFNIRGGLIVNPIGSFNQNHDGPKWEFVERPDQASRLLPATFRNVGAGVYGKFHKKDWIFGYEAYLTNSFNENIINNSERRTFLPAVKEEDRPGRASIGYDESQVDDFDNFTGKPMFTGKIAIKKRKIGEVGFSYMGGAYNKKEEDEGLALHTKNRRVDVAAFDFNTELKPTKTKIRGEASYIWVDVPDTYTQLYGNRQWGLFTDIVQPILTRDLLGWKDATVNLAARLDFVDYNVGRFKETDERIGDEVLAVTPALTFRPTPQTVFRFNYRFQWEKDELRNPAEASGTWYFGVSTYF